MQNLAIAIGLFIQGRIPNVTSVLIMADAAALVLAAMVGFIAQSQSTQLPNG